MSRERNTLCVSSLRILTNRNNLSNKSNTDADEKNLLYICFFHLFLPLKLVRLSFYVYICNIYPIMPY